MAIGNIGKGAIISYIAIFLNIAISFLYTPWMLRQIGVSDYGLYSLILSFMSYFTIDFGLSSAIARFIAKYRAEGDDKKVENIIGLSLKIFCVIDVVIFLCLFVCYFFIADIFKGLTLEEISKLKVLYIISGTFSILSFGLKPLDGVLVAYEYFVPAKVMDMVYKVGSVLFVVVALLLGGDIYILVLINGGLSFITQLLKFLYWHRKTNLFPNIEYYENNERKELFSYSFWSFMMGMAMRFRISFIPTILGIFSNSGQIAVFSLGITIEAMMWTISSALNGLFLPKVSKLYHHNNKEEIMNLMINVGRIQLFLFMAIYSVFFIFGSNFILLWVGDYYREAYYVVLFLTFAHIIGNTTHVAIDLVYASNKIKIIACVTFICSLFSIIISCYVAGQFGAIGCAICSGIAILFTQLIYLLIFAVRLNLDIRSFLYNCHLKIFPIILIITLLCHFVIKNIDTCNYIILFGLISLYLSLYIFVCYYILFNDYEKTLLRSILKFNYKYS